jgi:sec-independent protein translocase protein TatC
MALLSFLNKRTGEEKAEMSFVDHLEALRWHLVRAVIAVLLGATAIFVFQDEVFDFVILGPLSKNFVTYTALCNFSHWVNMGDALCMPPPDVQLQTTQFGTQFFSSISIAFIGGFMAAFPYIFWEVWKFIKDSARGAIFWVSFFFFTGAAFGYFVLGPFTFSFLSNFKLGTQQLIQTRPTLDDYIDNLTNVTLGAGLAFQLPIVSYVLSRVGLVTPKFLRTYRKYAVVGILVLSAIITPSPDWMSQMIVFIPLMGLYELGIVVSSRVQKQRLKKEKEWS